MKEFDGKISFFMGANTPNGFVSLFDGLYNPKEKSRCYIIKGGPGTGKSALMKRIAKEGEDNGYLVEYVNCSSDPHSLDAVLLPELNVCLADGTAPHVLEPRFPGACERLVNLGEYWDADQLFRHSEEIIELTERCTAMHKKCIHFLASVALLSNDSAKIFARLIDLDKIRRYASRLAAREFPSGSHALSTSGEEKRRFLSAVTPEGVILHSNTIEQLCEKAYVFEDESGVVACVILAVLRDIAQDCGLDLITCHCPLSPYDKIEHLFLPQLNLGFFTSNSYHPISIQNGKVVHAKRFWDNAALSDYRNRLAFTRKTQRELTEEAVKYLSQAKSLHDKLEHHYITAMDFDLVNQKTAQLMDEIFF